MDSSDEHTDRGLIGSHPGRFPLPIPAAIADPGGTAARRAAGAHARKSVWAAAALLLAVAGTLGAVLGSRAVARTDADKQRLAFHLAAEEITSTLQLAIQHEEDLVVNASAFVSGTPRITARSFDRWAETVRAMERYPELLNIGLVKMVPASRLGQFEAQLATSPVEPLGVGRAGPSERFAVTPPGTRPYYCFAVAGLSRNLATYLPSGLDFCALTGALISSRDSGRSSYAPLVAAGTTTLGVQTPVYRGGRVPSTSAARRRSFIGWIGELLAPQTLLRRALTGHANTAVTFRFDAGRSHIVFHSGSAPARGQATAIDLHNGWSVRSATVAASASVLDDSYALTLLLGGTLLSVLIALLVFLLGTGRMRALYLVRQKTRELSHQALHDTLTGLPNRALVMDRAEQMLSRTSRQPGMVAGALFVDIDGFKRVNDNLGHAAGDRLLQIVGERLTRAVRDQDTVGRLGGDEFVLLVESTAQEATADLLADRLIDCLREPVELPGARTVFSITASIGVAVGQYSTPDAMLRDADLALYAAKAGGKDRYSLFDSSMHADVEGREELEADLAKALGQGQFFLLYQPIVELATGAIVGVEALLRWRHPTRGIVAPDEFIPVAEASGMIVPIGRWVLEQACRQAGGWAAAGREIGVSINVSGHQLAQAGFCQDVARVLEETGMAPSSLMLEVTETTIMRDIQAACEHLEQIKDLGVRVALDDFGTGYASLSQLQRMPADIIKVDRSFVAALEEGGQSRELLEAILGVGRSLSLKVVAEGIETEEQLAVLADLGCEMAQGFFLGRPTPAEVIDGLLGLPSLGAGAASAAP